MEEKHWILSELQKSNFKMHNYGKPTIGVVFFYQSTYKKFYLQLIMLLLFRFWVVCSQDLDM